MTDWTSAKRLLAQKWANNPQKAAKALNAINAVQAGLAELASLGHVWDINFDPQVEAAQWPKMLYHRELAPNGQVFDTERDVPTVPGWFDSPDYVVRKQLGPAPAPATIGAAKEIVDPNKNLELRPVVLDPRPVGPRFVDGKPVETVVVRPPEGAI